MEEIIWFILKQVDDIKSRHDKNTPKDVQIWAKQSGTIGKKSGIY
jgi:hypothetical protein